MAAVRQVFDSVTGDEIADVVRAREGYFHYDSEEGKETKESENGEREKRRLL